MGCLFVVNQCGQWISHEFVIYSCHKKLTSGSWFPFWWKDIKAFNGTEIVDMVLHILLFVTLSISNNVKPALCEMVIYSITIRFTTSETFIKTWY